MDWAQVVAVGLVLASHALALRRPWRALGRQELPRVVDFATLGVVGFYDLGLAAELGGADLGLGLFEPFLAAPTWTWVGGLTLIALAPWALRVGASLAWRLRHRRHGPPLGPPEAGRLPMTFWLVAWAMTLTAALIGLVTARTQPTLYDARQIVTTWGPAALLLFLPLYLLVFAIGRGVATRPRGLVGCLGLALGATAAALPVAQRGRLLLPVALLLLFRTAPSPKRLLIGGVAVLAAATLLLPVTKSRHLGGQTTPAEWLAHTAGDLARAPVLRLTLDVSPALGTAVLPYPGAGYIAAAVAFVPRTLIPSKGYSTQQLATAYHLGQSVETMTWSLGFGLLDEAVLNVGWLAALPLLVLYGAGLGTLDALSRRRVGLRLPCRLGAVAVVAGGTITVLVAFGLMAAVGWACERLWPVAPRAVRAHRPRVHRRLAHG